MATVAFRRPACRELFELPHGPAFGRNFQALFLAFVGLAVESLRDRCGAADFTEQQDFYVKFAALVRDPQHVSNSHGARGFEGLPSGLDPAQIAGFGRQGPGLEEAGSPKPLVYSYGGGQIISPPAPALQRR
jgi:hypothetical protein